MKSKKSQTKKLTFNLLTSKKLLALKALTTSKALVSFKYSFNISILSNTNILWNVLSNSALSKMDYTEWDKIQSNSWSLYSLANNGKL